MKSKSTVKEKKTTERDLTDDAVIAWYEGLMKDVRRAVEELGRRAETNERMRDWCVREMEKVRKG